MIRSMTGYGRAEAPGTRTILSVECKSVNHRHLDISLKLPRILGEHAFVDRHTANECLVHRR